jgi:hypothetical protein
MGKASIAAGSIAVGTYSTYSTILFTASLNPVPLGLTVLLWIAYIATAVFVFTGSWWIINKIIWARNPIRITIDKSRGKSYISKSPREYGFKITYSLEIDNPPKRINSPQLCFESEVLDAVEGSFSMESKKDTYENTFILSNSSHSFGSVQNSEKFRLTFFALGKERSSEEFELTQADMLISVPFLNVSAAPVQSEHMLDGLTKVDED